VAHQRRGVLLGYCSEWGINELLFHDLEAFDNFRTDIIDSLSGVFH
jgi:hypothetical protein